MQSPHAIEHRLPQGHTQRITCGCFTSGGAQLLTGAADCEARVWAISDGACLRVVRGHAKYITCMVRLAMLMGNGHAVQHSHALRAQ